MKLAAIFKGLVVGVAILGICLPQPVLASTPVKQSPVVVDVALGQGGLLIGQVVDPNGAVKANEPVSLRLGDHELAKAKKNSSNGRPVSSRGTKSAMTVPSCCIATYEGDPPKS